MIILIIYKCIFDKNKYNKIAFDKHNNKFKYTIVYKFDIDIIAFNLFCNGKTRNTFCIIALN